MTGRQIDAVADVEGRPDPLVSRRQPNRDRGAGHPAGAQDCSLGRLSPLLANHSFLGRHGPGWPSIGPILARLLIFHASIPLQAFSKIQIASKLPGCDTLVRETGTGRDQDLLALPCGNRIPCRFEGQANTAPRLDLRRTTHRDSGGPRHQRSLADVRSREGSIVL